AKPQVASRTAANRTRCAIDSPPTGRRAGLAGRHPHAIPAPPVGVRSFPRGTDMLFLTFWCALYLGLVFPIYWAVRVPSLRLLCLLVACAVFHTHFAGPAGVLPIIVLATLTYLAGRWRHRGVCAAVIVLNVAALVFYKYTRFLCVSLIGKL